MSEWANHYISDIRAERDALRAKVARVEALADGLDAASTRFHTRFVASGDPYEEGSMDALTTASRRIRTALGYTEVNVGE